MKDYLKQPPIRAYVDLGSLFAREVELPGLCCDPHYTGEGKKTEAGSRTGDHYRPLHYEAGGAGSRMRVGDDLRLQLSVDYPACPGGRSYTRHGPSFHGT